MDPIRISEWDFEYNCTIKDFKTSNYGKEGTQYDDSLIFMELSPYVTYALLFLPEEYQEREDYMNYLRTENLIYQYIIKVLVALPEPRQDNYASDISQTTSHILGIFDKIVDSVGFYPVYNENPLLSELSIHSKQLNVLDQILSLMVFVLVAISTILIYS